MTTATITLDSILERAALDWRAYRAVHPPIPEAEWEKLSDEEVRVIEEVIRPAGWEFAFSAIPMNSSDLQAVAGDPQLWCVRLEIHAETIEEAVRRNIEILISRQCSAIDAKLAGEGAQ